MNYLLKFTILTVLVFFSKKDTNAQITAKFSADNAYAVYTGNFDQVTNKILPTSGNGVANTQARMIFNATEQNGISCSENGYFYVIAWADNSGCQGLIGEFTGAQTIKTGDLGWEVFATGKNYNPNGAPTPSIINSQIAIANTQGWNTPHKGPRNDQTNTVCSSYRTVSKVQGISDDAHWVWHDKGNHNHPNSPFKAHNHDEFLIFRFPCSKISGSSNSQPEISECDCIPESLYSDVTTASLFEIKNVSGPLNNFTYNLNYEPTASFATKNKTWNSWINSKFNTSGNSSIQIVHQISLHEYTGSGSNISDTSLEYFHSSSPYFPHIPPHFKTRLERNKKYFIKHGVYYGVKDNSKPAISNKCGWQESRYYIYTESGDNPTLKIVNSNGKIIRKIDASRSTKNIKRNNRKQSKG